MRKIVSLALALMLVAAMLPVSAADTACKVGDLNNDGIFNGKDANIMITVLSGSFFPEDTGVCDINCDGYLNAKDANLLLLVLNGEYTIPQPSEVVLTIDGVNNKYLSDITDSDIITDGYDASLFSVSFELEKDFESNQLTVSYRLVSLDKSYLSSLNTVIFSGFRNTGIQPETPDAGKVSALLRVSPDTALTASPGDTVSISVSLSDAPQTDVLLSFAPRSGALCSAAPDTLLFTGDNYSVPQTVALTVSADAGGTDGLFVDILYCESVVSTVTVDITPASPELITEEIVPFASGIITVPLCCYTAYYDVDFHIERLFAEFNGDGKWTELTSGNSRYDEDNYFTNNACTFIIPTEYTSTSPTVRLKAQYSKKAVKLSGTPTLTLEGCRIKATLGGKTEYYSPWATIPTTLVGKTPVRISDYVKFERTSPSGVKESFYLALRPKSESSFTVNGLSPTSFEKKLTVSQDLRKIYYLRAYSYYTKMHDSAEIKFVDITDPTLGNYDEWRMILKESVDTFNSCLGVAGINAHMTEVSPGESNNFITYGVVPSGDAGTCQYSPTTGSFHIFVTNEEFTLSTPNEIKSTTVHEMGHLLGFNDSAYAIDDSIYSYARDHRAVTYFQPNDIITMIEWEKSK